MTIWRDLPPLSALRAYAAWAESGSMSAAGKVLNVSHAAISQQIRALESHLGVTLVDRSAGLPRPTTEGQLLAEELRTGFSGIARVVAELTGADNLRPLEVTLTPAFAMAWLLPRLPSFREASPGVQLRLDTTIEERPLVAGGIDLAIRYGRGEWPGLEAEMLMPSETVVVGAASITGGVGYSDYAAMARMNWITEPACDEHEVLLARHGQRLAPDRTVYLPAPVLLQALHEGQGLAIAASLLVERDVAEGRLAILARQDEGEGYWLVRRPGPMRPAARSFSRWLAREAKAFAAARPTV